MSNFKAMSKHLLVSGLKQFGITNKDVEVTWYEPVTKEWLPKLFVKFKKDVMIDDSLEKHLNKGGAQIDNLYGDEMEIILFENFHSLYDRWKKSRNGNN